MIEWERQIGEKESQASGSNSMIRSSEPLSPAEFAIEYRASARALWGVAVGVLGDASLAEDVVQEAAVLALGKLDQFERGTRFAAWMGQMVRFVALNRGRRESRRRPAGLDSQVVEQLASDRGRTVSMSSAVESGIGLDDAMREALEDVGEVARACLLLRTLEGMDYARIAELLGIPAGTAMSHVHRTRRLLRQRLSGAGDDGPERSGAREKR